MFMRNVVPKSVEIFRKFMIFEKEVRRHVMLTILMDWGTASPLCFYDGERTYNNIGNCSIEHMDGGEKGGIYPECIRMRTKETPRMYSKEKRAKREDCWGNIQRA